MCIFPTEFLNGFHATLNINRVFVHIRFCKGNSQFLWDWNLVLKSLLHVIVPHYHSTLFTGILQTRNAVLRAVGFKSELLPIPTSTLETQATLWFHIVLCQYLCRMKDQALFLPESLGTNRTGSRRNNRQFLQHIRVMLLYCWHKVH